MVGSIVKLAPTKNRKNFSPNEFTFEIITCIFAIVFSGSYITKFPSKYKFDGKLDISRKIQKWWWKIETSWYSWIIKYVIFAWNFDKELKFFSEMVPCMKQFKAIRLGYPYLDSYLGKCLLNLQAKCNRFKLHSCEHGSFKINVMAMSALQTYVQLVCQNLSRR